MPDKPLDPTRALRMAVEQLTEAMDRRLDFDAVQSSPTYQTRIAREQMAQGGIILRRPQAPSQAVEPEENRAGELSGHQSEAPNAPRGRRRPRRGYDRTPSEAQRQHAQEQWPAIDEFGPPEEGEKRNVTTGMTPEEEREAREERFAIPQYGEFKVDAYLRMARNLALRRSKTEFNPETEQSESIGPLANVAGLLNKAQAYAPEVKAGKQLLDKHVLSHVYAGTELGSSLGYSPQTGITGPYMFGLPNPLGQLTSEAGRQGLGQKLGALKATFGGGISMGQAEGLRNALSSEGFSNQEEGFAGLYTGGENEQLAEALEPSVKEGLSPEVAASFGNSVRYGNASIRDLRSSLQGLGSTAKTLKLGIDATADSLQKFAKESEAQGSSQIHGLVAGKEIAGATGMVPEATASVNQTPLGESIGLRYGVFPGTMGSQSGQLQTVAAKATINEALKMLHGTTTSFYNPETGKREVSATQEQNQIAQVSALFGLNPETIRRYKDFGPQIEAGSTSIGVMTRNKEKLERGQPFGEVEYLRHHQNVQNELIEAKATIKKEKEMMALNPETAKGSGWEDEIKKQNERIKAIKGHIAEHGKENVEKSGKELWGQDWKAISKSGLVSPEEGNEIRKEFGNWQERNKALLERAEKNQKAMTGEEENGVIELSQEAKKFFKLKFPNAYKEATNAGAGSGAQNSALPYQQGKNPNIEAYIKRVEASRQAETKSQEKG